MFTTSAQALESAIREDTISRNLVLLSTDYLLRGNKARAKRLLFLSTLRHGGMLDDLGDAERLELEELDAQGKHPFGHCDTCGAVCDSTGCTQNREHEIAIAG